MLIWLVAQIIDLGAADLSMVGALIRKAEATTTWLLIVGFAVVIVLLFLLAVALLVGAE